MDRPKTVCRVPMSQGSGLRSTGGFIDSWDGYKKDYGPLIQKPKAEGCARSGGCLGEKFYNVP